MIIRITIIFLFAAFNLHAQQYTLVEELNPGEGDGYSEWSDNVVLGDAIIFHGDNGETGRELYVLKDDKISLLKDIKEGKDDSYFRNVGVFKDRLYVNADKSWVTDGTPSGTKLATFKDEDGKVLNYPSVYFITDKFLYFIHEGKSYYYDGEVAKILMENEYLRLAEKPRKGGDLFFYWQEDERYLVVSKHTDGDSLQQLAKIDIGSFSGKKIENIKQFDGGLIFSIYFYSDARYESYYYLYDSKRLTKLEGFVKEQEIPIAGGFIGVIDVKVKYFSKKYPGGKHLTSSGPLFYQGQRWPSAHFGDKVLFQFEDSWSDGAKYAVYDAKLGRVTSSFTSRDKYPSQFITDGKNVFFGLGTSNGFDAKIGRYDIQSDEFSVHKDLEKRAVETDFIQPIAIVNGYLYFASPMDKEKGREIYKIAIPSSVSTYDTDEVDFDVYYAKGQLRLSSSTVQPVTMDVYALEGALLHSFRDVVDGVEVDLHDGVYVVVLVSDGKRSVRTVVVTK